MKEARKTIQVNESVFNDFQERKEALGMNSTETLKLLLQQEVTRTETTVVSNQIKKRCE